MPKNVQTDRDTEIGKRIRAIRTGRKITLEAAAARVGVTYQQMQKYETGRNRTSAAMIVQLSGALDCHPMELLLSPEEREAGQAVADADFSSLLELHPVAQMNVRAILRAAIELGRLSAR